MSRARRVMHWRLTGLLLAGALLIGLDLGQRAQAPTPARAVLPAVAPQGPVSAPLRLAGGAIPMPPDTPAAHASSLLAMPPGQPAVLSAFWFAGTRESAADVQIAASQFDRTSQQWRAARWVVNRQQLGEQLGFAVRRLGNPVAWLDGNGRMHLFVVATGLGGWAASRIVQLRRRAGAGGFENLAFEPVRVLPLGWLWNTSHLVRSAPLPLQDGGMVLPVHFELGIKYPLALRFDAGGNFLGMVRISSRTHVLQPTLLPLRPTHWLALMRDGGPAGKVAAAQTTDGGLHWTDLPDLALDNPDASVAGLTLAPGHLQLAHNSSPHSRVALDLSSSADGRTWMLSQALAHGAGTDEYSYPALAWADNSLWVSYTDQRRRIAWQRFSWTSSPP